MAIQNTTMTAEEQYLAIMSELVEKGEADPDRTGVGRIRVFRRDIRMDLSDGHVPYITSRKIQLHHAIDELLWMISGSTNIKDLPLPTNPIWSSWAVQESHVDAFIKKNFYTGEGGEAETKVLAKLKDKLMRQYEGSIGMMYGRFWRYNEEIKESSMIPIKSLDVNLVPSDKYRQLEFEYNLLVQASEGSEVPDFEERISKDDYIRGEYLKQHDQIGDLIINLKTRPFSSRHLIVAWDPRYVPFEADLTPQENVLIGRGALTSCHVLSQFYVEKATDGGPNWLNLAMYQRSCDLALGVATNLPFYGLFLHLVAHCVGMRPKEFVWSGGDVHLYSNHFETVKEQLTREIHPHPKVTINPDVRDLFAIKASDIMISDYNHSGVLKYQVAV